MKELAEKVIIALMNTLVSMIVALLITGEILVEDGVPCTGVADGGAIDVTTIVLDSFPTFDTSIGCDIAKNINIDFASFLISSIICNTASIYLKFIKVRFIPC